VWKTTRVSGSLRFDGGAGILYESEASCSFKVESMFPDVTEASPTANGLHSQTNGTPSQKEPELSAESRDAMIHRAKDILAGRIIPPEMVTPPGIIEYLQKQFAGYDPGPTAEAMRDMIEHHTLYAHYSGRPIVLTRIEGKVAILAAGEEEIRALLPTLDSDEISRVLLHDML